jgi:hypothetical protein
MKAHTRHNASNYLAGIARVARHFLPEQLRMAQTLPDNVRMCNTRNRPFTGHNPGRDNTSSNDSNTEAG